MIRWYIGSNSKFLVGRGEYASGQHPFGRHSLCTTKLAESGGWTSYQLQSLLLSSFPQVPLFFVFSLNTPHAGLLFAGTNCSTFTDSQFPRSSKEKGNNKRGNWHGLYFYNGGKSSAPSQTAACSSTGQWSCLPLFPSHSFSLPGFYLHHQSLANHILDYSLIPQIICLICNFSESRSDQLNQMCVCVVYVRLFVLLLSVYLNWHGLLVLYRLLCHVSLEFSLSPANCHQMEHRLNITFLSNMPSLGTWHELVHASIISLFSLQSPIHILRKAICFAAK